MNVSKQLYCYTVSPLQCLRAWRRQLPPPLHFQNLYSASLLALRARSWHVYGVLAPRLRPRVAAAGTILAQVALLVLLLRVLPPWPGVPEPPGGGPLPLRVAVLRTGMLGVCVMAVLSGFGTVEFPYRVLRAFVVPVSAFEVRALQSQLETVKAEVRGSSAVHGPFSGEEVQERLARRWRQIETRGRGQIRGARAEPLDES